MSNLSDYPLKGYITFIIEANKAPTAIFAYDDIPLSPETILWANMALREAIEEMLY